MSSFNYKQYDTRWSGLPYPTRKWNIGNSGCGEVSICNMIAEMNLYKADTPASIQPYCVQFAAPNGDGTYLSGIPKMMKHYGMTEVAEHDTMGQLWAELEKGGRAAVYLMGKKGGGSKGVHWTSGGHFVCSTDYKYENGKHWVYVKDSNSSSDLRNGWITYEDNMRGDVCNVWSGKLAGGPVVLPTPKRGLYPGKYPAPKKYLEYGDQGTEVKNLKSYINWSYGGQEGFTPISEDGDYGSDTLFWTSLWQDQALGAGQGNGEVGPKTIAKMKEYGGYSPDPEPKKKYEGEYPNPKKYLELGDKGTDVGKLQNYLNWYTDGEFFRECGPADNNYGQNTLKYTKCMQTDFFGSDEADGKVGPKTINKMKEVGGYTPTDLEPWFNALRTQYDWSKNQDYNWVTPTIASSKKEGTCITLVAVALQRLGLLASGKYFYFNPKTKKIGGSGASYAKAHPEIFEIMYPDKKISALWKSGAIQVGDIVGWGGTTYHTMVFMGVNSKGKFIFDTMGRGKRGLNVEYPYYAKRAVNMIVRLKKTK